MMASSPPCAASRSVPGGGFSLLEVMVGAAVLVFGLCGLAASMVTAYRVEQQAQEKKIALNWASSQLEKVRGMTVVELLETPPDGFRIDAAWTDAGEVGVRRDSATDPNYFARYFYSDPNKAAYVNGAITVPLYDSTLLGLRNPDDAAYTARLEFREPRTTASGVGKNSGYWVTAIVRWKGVAGASVLKLGTYVGR